MNSNFRFLVFHCSLVVLVLELGFEPHSSWIDLEPYFLDIVEISPKICFFCVCIFSALIRVFGSTFDCCCWNPPAKLHLFTYQSE